MTRRQRRWRHKAGMVLMLAAALAVAPLPGVAAEPQSSAKAPPKPGIRASVERAVVALPPAPRVEVRARQTQTAGNEESRDRWAFFKSPAGVAALAVLGAGVGYALYSTQHDRVSSPGKK